MDLLCVEHVTKRYATHTALHDVSLAIPRGAVYGLLGPNGAGKTTLIRIINRITAPDEGRVLLGGRCLAPEDVRRIGYLPEERGLYKKMKVGEQALYFAQLKGLSKREATLRLKRWFEKFGIAGWWDKKVEELSKGMAQKVQFIVTVLHEPELLIFDEPFSGFDPVNANLLKNEILALRDAGATIVFSTHNMSSVEEICDHITLIDRSRNVLSGPVDEVRRRHGGNVFRIDFAGDLSALDLQALERVARVVAEPRPEGRLLTMRLQLPSADSVRSALSLLNERIEICGFEEIIPSMNDIFIRAVGGEL
ncbi:MULTISPECIES: ATP-binding cassette domain-containing protein [Alistipes]|uniref:ABC transporter ATP-binding protein n=1 Tax=Alistipes TaxID=239759 RepID=UPI001EBDBD6C|nr:MULTISPECIES: ATP-binding cassette domain-containing protein [Alistipes]MBS1364913.1 ABC transporter ATP-binding protein [Alistipes sp.]